MKLPGADLQSSPNLLRQNRKIIMVFVPFRAQKVNLSLFDVDQNCLFVDCNWSSKPKTTLIRDDWRILVPYIYIRHKEKMATGFG